MAKTHSMAALLALVLATAALAPATAQITNMRLFVNTALGRIRGAACPGNSNTFRWLGIPYAQPPTGALRWAAPVAYSTQFPTPEFPATRAGLACPQDSTGATPVGGTSEDCLTINVWAPLNVSVRQPVRVLIHGDDLVTGSGGLPAYDGCQVSADANVLTVTFNYRLGVLGWLGAPGLGSGSGNFGLLDTQLALQWVQTNIGAFGGDPTRVTLHGQGRAASVVLANWVSPATYNGTSYPAARLFSAVLLESPDIYAYQNVNDTNLQGSEFSANANCTVGNLACLRALSVASVLAAQRRMVLQGFGPTIDGTIVPSPPLALLDLGRAPRIPVMLTTTTDEGRLAPALSAGPSGVLTQQQAQQIIIAQTNPPTQYRQEVLDTYNAQAFGGSWFNAAATAITEARYHAGAAAVMDAVSNLGSNVFGGIYVMPQSNGCAYRSLGLTAAQAQSLGPILGAIHGVTIPAYFEHPLVGSGAGPFPWNCSASDYTADERQAAAFVAGAIAAFADHRNPIPRTSLTATSAPLQALTAWPRYQANFGAASGKDLLWISTTGPRTVTRSPEAIARCDLWNDIRLWQDTNGRYGRTPSVQAFIQSRPDLSIAMAVSQAAGDWTSLLSSAATYFIPTNDAFNAYLAAQNVTAAQVLALPQATLQAVLRYHVYPIPMDVERADPPRHRQTMMNGLPAYIMRTGDQVRVLDVNLNAALVDPSATSIMAGASYVNIIDRVLDSACHA